MKRKSADTPMAALNLRGIPRPVFYRLKMAAAAEQKKSVRDWIMGLIEARIDELERKGILPKGK